MTWNDLAQAKYALLTTYKKDGTAVGTPVWVAPDGDRLVIWTNPKTWKVKRIRRNPSVTLQVCDNRGRTAGGEIVAGTAEVLDEDGTERVRGVIGRKYGVLGTLAVRGHKLFLGKDRSVGLSVTPRAAE
ncbi:PPOX class F420-dependent oxidoreductase [Nocardia blacklockiae]|uniref:PPOX class F420-dependent oxidoreductase n=1 Tax=Nocardia blacklockiae TaxID=480036 RepID=UPI001895E2D2|nr:PPOX class F420-dependent oxidoreductase [Nocardia blacklockiae]MBF6170557.1 PPOX class F420-dependent oxidoreductase [Nocardia blacklockiae]